MLPSEKDLYSFSNIMLNQILHLLQKHGFILKEYRGLHWPGCSPDLSPTENIWCIMKHKTKQRRLTAVEQLESYIRQEWDNIPLPKVQHLGYVSLSYCEQNLV